MKIRIGSGVARRVGCWPRAAPVCPTPRSRRARLRRATDDTASGVNARRRDTARRRSTDTTLAATSVDQRPSAAGGPNGHDRGRQRRRRAGPNQASDVGITATTITLGNITAENGVLGDAFAPAARGVRAWVAAHERERAASTVARSSSRRATTARTAPATLRARSNSSNTTRCSRSSATTPRRTAARRNT